jgi:hypothetical protein
MRADWVTQSNAHHAPTSWRGPTCQPVTAQPDCGCVTPSTGRAECALCADAGTRRQILTETDRPLVPAAAFDSRTC